MMIISLSKIIKDLTKEIKKEIKKTKKKPKLTLFLIENGQKEQQEAVVLKKKVAKKLGIKLELVNLKTPPHFEKFIRLIKEKADEKETTAILIEKPLPAQLATESIYYSIPVNKEIEGHSKKTPFYPPIGLTVLIILKSIFLKIKNDELFINKKDISFFKKIFHHKKVVLISKNNIDYQSIGRILTQFKINYFGLNSKTDNPEIYLKQADVVISTIKEKIITPETLKPGVILINVGLKKENNKLKGAYEEKEIKKIAGFYTPINKEIIHLETICLYKNLLEAAKLQNYF